MQSYYDLIRTCYYLSTSLLQVGRPLNFNFSLDVQGKGPNIPVKYAYSCSISI